MIPAGPGASLFFVVSTGLRDSVPGGLFVVRTIRATTSRLLAELVRVRREPCAIVTTRQPCREPLAPELLDDGAQKKTTESWRPTGAGYARQAVLPHW